MEKKREVGEHETRSVLATFLPANARKSAIVSTFDSPLIHPDVQRCGKIEGEKMQ